MATTRPPARRIVAATLVLAAGLALFGWYDYRATRTDLLTVLIEQAASLRQAVSAAARSAAAASAQAQASLGARLLDNARLLDRLDQAGGLTPAVLEDVARQHRLFRVTVFSATGERVMSAGLGGPPAGAGRGFGPGPGGQGAGRGFGPGPGGQGGGVGGTLAERLISAGEAEAISEVHGSRWGQGWRLSAGIRRTRGGAIVLNVDAADIADLQQQASPDHLLEDITTGAREVVYVILVDGTSRSAYGRLANAAIAAPDSLTAASEALPLARRIADLTAYELQVSDTPVLEFGGPVDPSRQGGPFLRLGLSLEGLRSAERRALTRVLVSVPAMLGLGGLVLAFLTLRREHGALREEHARAQEALRRRDRLAAMGELASTVAHEVRNPLNAIGMSVQRLRREFAGAAAGLPPDVRDEQQELLDVLGSETRRIDRIVQQFLEFARPPRLAPRDTDVETLVNAVAVAAEALAAARGIRLDVGAQGAGAAWLDADQLRQALDNLVRNAIEASPAGGAVTIRAARDDRGHRIVVADSGPGIAPEHLPKIFDLYFTTKADGTGVGLAVTHQIIDAHGGTIEVDSAPGRGTRMIVTLPARAPEAAHA